VSESRPNHLKNSIEPEKQAAAWVARQRSRERKKIIGLLFIAFLILALALVRFGRTIAWGAR
jgi:hypothetical protein